MKGLSDEEYKKCNQAFWDWVQNYKYPFRHYMSELDCAEIGWEYCWEYLKNREAEAGNGEAE